MFLNMEASKMLEPVLQVFLDTYSMCPAPAGPFLKSPITTRVYDIVALHSHVGVGRLPFSLQKQDLLQ